MNNELNLEQLIHKYGIAVYDIVGQSMMPLLKEGLDKVQLVKPTDLVLFDVVLYKNKNNNNNVLHRIIDINGDDLTILGDNNNFLEYRKKKDIIAKLDGIYESGVFYDTKSKRYLDYLNNIYPYKNEENRKKVLTNTSQFFLDRQKEAYFQLAKLEITGSLDVNTINCLTPSEKHNLIINSKLQKSFQLLAFSVASYGVDFGEEYNNKIIKRAENIAMVNIREDLAIERISDALTKHNIPHMFLKGSETKKLYRFPNLRTRNDIDLFVTKENFVAACNVLKDDLKAQYHHCTSHDESYIYPLLQVNIELHHTLDDKLPKDLRYLLKNPFDDATKVGNTSRYVMSYSKTLLLTLVHSAKHLRFGETWISMLLDFYYLSKISDLSIIKEARLENYYNTLNDYIEHILTGKKLTTSEQYFANLWYIDKSKYLNVINLKHSSRISYYFHRIFMPYSELINSYERLAKMPFLYPYYLIKRMFTILFNKSRRGNVKLELAVKASIEKEESLAVEDVGLGEYTGKL